MHAISSFEEAHALLALANDELFARASALREAHFGQAIDLCAIINARSGNCSMNCAFCSQSRFNATGIETHPLLPPNELKARILALATLPVRIGIVTSGAMLSEHELTSLCETLASLPKKLLGRICVSLGRLDAKRFAKLKDAGLTRFHHNLETAKSFYPTICTSQLWQERLETVRLARSFGFINCTGGLFGLGESWQDRIDLAFTLRKEGVQHIPMNFLHPHPHTPLADRSPLSADEALRILALFRCILPDATLRVCGGRPLVLGKREEEIFKAGANALMVGDYLTTKGNGPEHDLAMLTRLGLHPSLKILETT